MEGFDHILNWKLLGSSHQFPGQNGGTCINEAAIVAAGFDYRPIRNVQEMPKCFSRPICQFAMLLNDEAKDTDRQRLLSFVTRLACADSDEVEQERQSYISYRMTRFMSFTQRIEILEGALSIGRQADPLALPTVEERMSAVKKASVAVSRPAKPVFSKAKKWLEMMAT